jgi:hypothetical protein
MWKQRKAEAMSEPTINPDVQKALHRAANALEHIACSLMAIEMMQAGQADGSYEGSLHVHQCFQHDACTPCGTKARH